VNVWKNVTEAVKLARPMQEVVRGLQALRGIADLGRNHRGRVGPDRHALRRHGS